MTKTILPRKKPLPLTNRITKAGEILVNAAELVCGERAQAYGDAHIMCCNIARLWRAYIANRPTSMLDATDVAQMLSLMKIARTQTDGYQEDNFTDAAGYSGIAGMCAEKDRAAPPQEDG